MSPKIILAVSGDKLHNDSRPHFRVLPQPTHLKSRFFLIVHRDSEQQNIACVPT